MTFTPATISGSILDYLDGVQYARVQMIRLEGPAIDGDDAHLAGIDVQYSPTKTTPAPVVATGTYRVIVTATTKSFPKRDFTAPIAGDTSWGEVLSCDGTGYEYTPDERARLVAVEQAVAGGIGGSDPYTSHGTWDEDSAITTAGTHVLTLDTDATISLPALDNGAVLVLWIEPAGHMALIAGYEVALEAPGVATFQRIGGTWRLVSAVETPEAAITLLYPSGSLFPSTNVYPIGA